MTAPRAARRLLMIAYYFPPAGGAGVQRSVKFARYLPECGWQPTVLTVTHGRFTAEDPSLLAEVGAPVRVMRTGTIEPHRVPLVQRARDAKYRDAHAASVRPLYRTLRAVRDAFFVPDEQAGWVIPAALAALRAHRREPFDAVYTTSAPYSAHVTGAFLRRAIGVPWVADFRDGWIDNPYFGPPTAWRRWCETRMEAHVLHRADAVTCAPPGLPDLLRLKIATREREKVHAITNGYDEEDFTGEPMRGRWPVTFVYIGSFFHDWSPAPLVRALHAALVERPDLRGRVGWSIVGAADADNARRLDQLIDELSLHDAIERVGYVSHAESVRRLCGADVLVCVVARAEESRAQFPAKVFEYMRSGRPVLGVMPDGPTAEILRRGGATTFARYDDERAIASALIACADRTLAGTAPRGDLAAVQPYERRRLAQQLASILDRLAAERRAR